MIAAIAWTPASAQADACTVSGVGATWNGSPPCSGNATIDCGAGACSADDTFFVTGSIHVDSTWGAPEAPGTGWVFVEDGASLSFDPAVAFHHAGRLIYRDGSDGTIQGTVLPAVEAPDSIDFPTPTEIRLDFSARTDADGDGIDEGVLPWALCDPSGVGLTCDESAVHPEDADPGEETPPTFLYVEWEKLGAPPDLQVSRAGGRRPVHSPGQWFPVVAVADSSGGGTLDTITVELPSLGPNLGHHYFGADRSVPADGAGRCPQCVDDGLGAPGQRSNPGGTLRNAVGEPQWRLDPGTPFQRAENAHGQVRWELWIDEAASDVNGHPPFLDDREFEGFLACRRASPGGATSPDPWCARIIRSFADLHDGGDDGTPAGEVLVVWKDPRGHLRSGDFLDVYYAHVSPGDALVPVNPVAFHGARSLTVQVSEGSLLGRSSPIRALWLRAPGPGSPSGQRSALRVRNFYDFEADLVLIEHQAGEVGGIFFGLHVDSEGNLDEGFRDSRIQRVTFRHPDGACFTLDDGDDLRFCAIAMRNNSRSLVPWTGVGFRKLRLENASTAFGNSRLWRAIDCADDLFAQDILALHARTVKDLRLGPQNEELVELRGSGQGCGYDRVALVGETGGSPTILRCANCEDGAIKYVTSLVVFGQLEAAFAITGNDDASNHVRLVNWMTDGRVRTHVPTAYGALVDYTPASPVDGAVVGWSQCNDTVGLFAVGTQGGGNLIRNCDRRPVGHGVDVLDLHLSNLGGDWSELLGTPQNLGVADLEIRWRNNLTHFRADAAHQRLLRASNPLTRTAFTIADSALLSARRAGTELLRFEPDYSGTLSFGPNVYTDDPSGRVATASVFVDTIRGIVADAFAPGGDGTAESGWRRAAQVTGSPLGTSGMGALRLAGPGPEPAPAACASEPCEFLEAMPRWSGPVVYDWPFAWATVDPVPGFRRNGPRVEYLPPRLVARLPAECLDGIDNDGDGWTDVDPGCSGPEDVSESSSLLPCDDGIDNDGDGSADYPADPGCEAPTSRREDPGCQDGINNDPIQDPDPGLIDFDGGQSIHGACSGGSCPPDVSDPDLDGIADPDPQCSGRPWSTETSCGLGFELALGLPILRWLRRRRGFRG